MAAFSRTAMSSRLLINRTIGLGKAEIPAATRLVSPFSLITLSIFFFFFLRMDGCMTDPFP